MEMARKKITKNECLATKPAGMTGNLEGARPKITRTKKVLFSAVTVLGFSPWWNWASGWQARQR